MDFTVSLELTLAMLGFCVLTGATPDSFSRCVENIMRRMWLTSRTSDIADFAVLKSIVDTDLRMFDTPPDGYLWVLNIYLRGAELLFETGLCPQFKIDSLREIDLEADKILNRREDGTVKFGFGPYHFAEWERRQSEEFLEKQRRRSFDITHASCLGMALRDFAKKKSAEPTRLHALLSGIHMAYIFGKPSENHIANMRNPDKQVFYFVKSHTRPMITVGKREHNACVMEGAHFVGTRAIFTAITRLLDVVADEHIRASCCSIPTVASSAEIRIGGWKPILDAKTLVTGWRAVAAKSFAKG